MNKLSASQNESRNVLQWPKFSTGTPSNAGKNEISESAYLPDPAERNSTAGSKFSRHLKIALV